MGTPRTRQTSASLIRSGFSSTGSAAPTATTAGLTLDAGALIALDRGNQRMRDLLRLAVAKGYRIHVPAGVVGQAWRDGRRQGALSRFLRSSQVEVIPLGDQLSRAAGELCGATKTADVIDASVVLVARQHRDLIVTSDPNDLRRLDPSAAFIGL